MTEIQIDYEKLGKEVAKNMDIHCRMGWKQEDIQTLSELAITVRQAKRTAFSAVIYLIVVALAGALLAGAAMKIKANGG
jgi:hypothetical protein